MAWFQHSFSCSCQREQWYFYKNKQYNNGDDTMSTFIINAGHTLQGKGTGAVGFLNESKENRAVANHVIKL